MTLKQKEIAKHLDLSIASVSAFLDKWNLNHRTMTLDEVRFVYISKLRDAAAGRGAGNGELDLTAERARLTKEQADKVELQNCVEKKEYLPASTLSIILSKTGRQIAGILEAIPVKLKHRSSISYDDLQFIKGEIVKARNLAADIKLVDLELEELDDAE